jgi:acetyl-CoA synthetase (ADP-forming)
MDEKRAGEIIEKARGEGRTSLSEYEAKQVLSSYGVPVSREVLVEKRGDLEEALSAIGYPLVMKACSADITHKTEKNLIRVDIRGREEADTAYDQISSGMKGAEGGVLVQQMVAGKRELVAGMTRDPQFGACVMFGLGGIFTEILEDIVFRKAPIDMAEALRMMQEIRGRRILDAVRGMEAADTKELAAILVRVGEIALENENVAEIDINPLILCGAKPVAVDALIVLMS